MEKVQKTMTRMDMISFSTEVAKHDTRMNRCKKHEARTIVFITLCAVICGWRTWDEICEFGKYKKHVMEKYLGPLEATPSADTIGRFFALIKPAKFEGAYRMWMKELFRLRTSPKGEKANREIIAIDGKEICGASAAEGSSVRVVSAYAVNSGISLGQEIVGEKTNEIPAVRTLVEELDIEGCVVTADALHCQKETCKAIIEAKGNFILFAKGNQKFLMQAVADAIDTALNSRDGIKIFDKNTQYSDKHGNDFTIRKCVVVTKASMLGNLYKEWPWIKSFGMITSEKTVEGQLIKETRYFISSLYDNAKYFLKACRDHWGVENGLHWRLDVDFQEDNARKRKNAATNFSLVTKMAIAILNSDDNGGKKIPMRRKKQRAALSDEYLQQLIDNFYLDL